MKLDLDTLFSLFEQLESDSLLVEEGQGPVSDQGEQKEFTKEEVYKIIVPPVVFTEKNIEIGKDVLDLIKDKLDGKTVAEKLTKLLSVEGLGKRSTTEFKTLIERMGILDGIISMFNNFEAQAAGSINEAVLASLFKGGERLDTNTANEENIVTDFTVGTKQYVLKTVAETSSRKSSAYNYINTLAKFGSITHVDCQKIQSGETLSGFRVTEFIVTPANIDKFLSISRGSGDLNYLLYDKATGKQIREITPSVLLAVFKKNPKYEARHWAPQATNTARPQVQDPLTETEEEEPGKLFLKQYKVSYNTNVATPQEIDFSKSMQIMRQEVLQLINGVHQNIGELSQAMQTISTSLSKYFTANSTEKSNLKNTMMQAANTVQPKTQKVLDT